MKIFLHVPPALVVPAPPPPPPCISIPSLSLLTFGVGVDVPEARGQSE